MDAVSVNSPNLTQSRIWNGCGFRKKPYFDPIPHFNRMQFQKIARFWPNLALKTDAVSVNSPILTRFRIQNGCGFSKKIIFDLIQYSKWMRFHQNAWFLFYSAFKMNAVSARIWFSGPSRSLNFDIYRPWSGLVLDFSNLFSVLVRYGPGPIWFSPWIPD